MNDLERLVLIQSKEAPCIKTLSGRPLKFSSQPPQIEMEFEARREFTHSDTEILQGGFVTGMILILFFNKKSKRKIKIIKGPWS